MNAFDCKTSLYSTILVGILLMIGSITPLVAQTSDNEDKDKDGVTVGQGDCDDYQPLVYPGANEIEDGQDNNCDGLVDVVMGDCDDFTDPGVIDGAETICGEQLPSRIENITSPTGGTGAMQVMWIYTINDPEIRASEWFIIPNAHDLSYQPFSISQTTWFRRCVRRAGCWKFPNESNIIKKEIVSGCLSVDCDDFVASVSSTTFPDCDGNLGSINLQINGGLAPIAYNWDDGTTTQNRAGLVGGFYGVTITDANNCEVVLDEIGIPTPTCLPDCSVFGVSIASSNAPDCDGNLGAIDLLINNGVLPINYEWSDGATTEDRSDLSGGNYQVTVTDANGCTGTAEVNIPTPDCNPACSNFSVEVESTIFPDCNGNFGAINLVANNAVEPIVYAWSDGANTQNRTGLVGGVYRVTVTDANSCLRTLQVDIATPNCGGGVLDCNAFFPQLVRSTRPDCAGNLGTIELSFMNGTTPVTYVWEDGATTANRTDLVEGKYSVTLTDAAGCTSNLEVSLTSPNCSVECADFAVQITSTTIPDCTDNLGSIDLTVENGAAPIIFNWQDGANTEDRTGLTGGIYAVTVSDVNGCFQVVEVPIPAPNCGQGCDNLIVSFTVQDVVCADNNGAIDVSVFGGTQPYTYTWSDIADNISDRNGLMIGNYELTVSDASGCEKMAAITVGTGNCSQEITPFDCSGALYQIVEGQFNRLDLANDTLIPLGEEANNLNPLGYNLEDDFIYGLRFGTTDVIKIGKHGKRENIGRVQGINVGITAGDFDLEGNFYLLDNESQRLQRVDVSGTILVAATVQLSENIPKIEDLSYHPTEKLLYGVSSSANEVYSINPVTGEVNNFTATGLPESGDVASTWMTSKGELIISYNVTAAVYLVDIANQTGTLIGNTGDSAANADGANCVQGPSPLEAFADGIFRFRNVNGTMTEEMAKIQYEVENESPNANYLLEHSIDGNNFKALPAMKAAKGTTISAYEIEDRSPILGNGFYRIKYVMEDGNHVYSDLVPLLFKPAGAPEVMVYPNPFTEEMTINFLDPLLKDAQIMVVNNLGKVMEVCSAAKGATRMNISCPNYPPGVYTIHIKHGRKLPIVYRTLKVE